MSQSLSVAASVEPAATRRTFVQHAEFACFVFVALNQIIGVLNPPEAFFFDPQAYSQDNGGGAPRPVPLTTAISHFSEVFTAFLLLRHWRAYVGIICRSPLIFLQVLIILSSTFWSIGQTESIRSSVHYLIDYVMALHLVYTYSVIGFAALLVRLSAVGAVISFVLLAVFPGVSHEIAGGAYATAWRGAYENKNFLGATSSISILVAGYSLLSAANDRRLALFVILANLALLAGSRSSTAIVATGVCLPILAVIGATRKPGAGIVIATVALGGLCFLSAALASVHDPFALLGKDSTLTGRTAVWHAVIPLIRQRPLLGYGLGFWDNDSDYRNDVWTSASWNAPHAHNDYLDIMLQTGLASFCIVMSNYLICIYFSARSMWRIKEGSVLCLVLILNFMIRGLTETFMTAPATPQIAVLYVAEIYLSLLAFPQRAPQAAVRPASRPRSSGLLDAAQMQRQAR